MLRVLAAVVVAALAIPAIAGAEPTTAERLGVPLPRASRSVAPDLVASGMSFRRTVAFYRRWLSRQGTAHRAVPVYQHGDTAVARFLSRAQRSSWLAIHVFRDGGRTRITVVPRASTGAASP